MTTEETADLVRRALAGDPTALTELVAVLTPVVQARVARTLLARRHGPNGRDVRQEVEDLTWKVFLTLFSRNARVLRDWKPGGRGLSLESFVRRVAEKLLAETSGKAP